MIPVMDAASRARKLAKQLNKLEEDNPTETSLFADDVLLNTFIPSISGPPRVVVEEAKGVKICLIWVFVFFGLMNLFSLFYSILNKERKAKIAAVAKEAQQQKKKFKRSGYQVRICSWLFFSIFTLFKLTFEFIS
jgi:hypothetical protein